MVSINNVAAVVVDGAVMVLMTAVKMNWGVDGVDGIDDDVDDDDGVDDDYIDFDGVDDDADDADGADDYHD